MLKRVVASLVVTAAGLGHLAAAAAAAAATIDGLWRSPTRASGAWITVEVAPCPDAPEQRCGTVEGAHDGANPAVVGEQVLKGLKRQEDGSWAEGRIIRPVEGKVYRAQVRLAGEDTLRVEGCALLGLVCKDQTWTRME